MNIPIVWIVVLSILTLKVAGLMVVFLGKKKPYRPFHLTSGPLPDERRAIVLRAAERRWGLAPKDLNRDLTADLRIPPGEINAFLEDLEERFGLVMFDGDRKEPTSLASILSGLRQKVYMES